MQVACSGSGPYSAAQKTGAAAQLDGAPGAVTAVDPFQDPRADAIDMTTAAAQECAERPLDLEPQNCPLGPRSLHAARFTNSVIPCFGPLLGVYESLRESLDLGWQEEIKCRIPSVIALSRAHHLRIFEIDYHNANP